MTKRTAEDGGELDQPEDDLSVSGNRIIHLPSLQSLISESCVCSSCTVGSLKLVETNRSGLAPTLQLCCENCGIETSTQMADIPVGKKFCDINRKSVLAMRVIGKSRKALQKICAVLDMPPPLSNSSFLRHRDELHAAAKDVAESSMSAAAKSVMRAGNEEPSDIAVTTDGTWMRRGYSSLYGVQTVIAWDSSKVVDVEILSRHCSACTQWSARKKNGTMSAEEYDLWLAGHKEVCQANTAVSSPSMETEAVKKIWSRSVEKHNLRYTTYIGDGDSKGHAAVNEMKIYGATKVEKEECVGHVQKRVGKNLRDLKSRLGSKKLSDGKSIGGRGRLTDVLINSMQNYYGMAVRSNSGSVAEMARAIWASFCHTFSTDASPKHDFCPAGAQSWCDWQKAKAKGKSYSHTKNLSPAIRDEVKPVYMRLTEKSLLDRCTRGATQNANESLNNMIWQFCPKESFCSSRIVETAVYLAVIIFNDGYMKLEAVLDKMSCSTGVFTGHALEHFEQRRAYHKTRKSSDDEQQARKRRQALKKGFGDAAAEKEGVTYSAGGF